MAWVNDCARCDGSFYVPDEKHGRIRCECESSLYSPDVAFTICEACFLWEEDLIEQTGSNDHPEVVKSYKVT